MRRLITPVLLALAVALPAAAPARAQDTVPRRMTADAARRVVEVYNDPHALHLGAGARIPAGTTFRGNVASLDGDVSIAGRVDGDVVVINGNVHLLAGAEITGALTVVGGAVSREGAPRVGGPVAVYADRLDYLRRGERIFADVDGERIGTVARADTAAPAAVDTIRDAEGDVALGDTSHARDDEWRRTDQAESDSGWAVERRSVMHGRADFVVAVGQSYNRVEGLPITFGPVVQTESRNPLRLRAMGIFRTEAGPELGPERWGYEAKLEQFLFGRGEFRVGGSAFRRIDPIEDWHLTKLENGLSTFFLHRDYRDHFEREGLSAFITVTPRGSPFEATLAFRSEKERSEPAGSPFTLFDNSEAWRPQPLAAHGRLESLVLGSRVDTRSTADDPASGWYLSTEVEQGLGSSLRQPDYLAVFDASAPGPFPIIPGTEYGTFTSGTVDVRRYNRIGPWSRLNLRVLAAGSLDGSPLPPQRQHALGGEGTLPGFALFSRDCGARRTRIYRSNDVAGRTPETLAEVPQYFVAYGCDRVALVQAEYRGDLSLRLRWGGDDDDGEGDGWAETALRNGLNAGFGWVLFADAGRGWTLDDRLEGTDTAVDVGAGVIIGRLGVYAAIPVSEGGRVNLFIRLSPRI
ncbi:MAG TPA: polymer-forming cytoskeletal protein [Longimicrobium sp.]|nr:polymer-forming cytoskeletal protein [Longimicrobium sp.]